MRLWRRHQRIASEPGARRLGHANVSLRHQPGRRERQRSDRRCERGRRLLLGRHPKLGERGVADGIRHELGDHRRGVVGHSGAVDLGDDGPRLRRSRLRGLSPRTQGERRHRLNKISFSIAIGGRLRAVPFFAGCQGTRRRPSCRRRKKRGAGRRPRKSNSGRFTGEELNSPIDRLVRASKLRGLRHPRGPAADGRAIVSKSRTRRTLASRRPSRRVASQADAHPGIRDCDPTCLGGADATGRDGAPIRGKSSSATAKLERSIRPERIQPRPSSPRGIGQAADPTSPSRIGYPDGPRRATQWLRPAVPAVRAAIPARRLIYRKGANRRSPYFRCNSVHN